MAVIIVYVLGVTQVCIIKMGNIRDTGWVADQREIVRLQLVTFISIVEGRQGRSQFSCDTINMITNVCIGWSGDIMMN